MPGETVDVDVTFPEDYHEELAGKDAVFSITVNGSVTAIPLYSFKVTRLSTSRSFELFERKYVSNMLRRQIQERKMVRFAGDHDIDFDP